MFTELTAEELRNLDLKMYHAERDSKSRISALVVMKRTQKILAKIESYAGIVSDVYGVRDDLMDTAPHGDGLSFRYSA
jgi:hypothetical protein